MPDADENDVRTRCLIDLETHREMWIAYKGGAGWAGWRWLHEGPIADTPEEARRLFKEAYPDSEDQQPTSHA